MPVGAQLFNVMQICHLQGMKKNDSLGRLKGGLMWSTRELGWLSKFVIRFASAKFRQIKD